MASLTENESFSDVRKVGYLRKPKSMHKRFFVLRAATEAGPARLEYYENEKKWKHKSGAPKRSVPLETCFNINKRSDSKNKYLVALYTKDEYFAIAADSDQEQETWYQALVDLHNRGKVHDAAGGSGPADGEDSYGELTPGPAFKDVWQVILKPKGLGQTKNLIGIYRLCLTNKTISFVKLNSDAAAVVLQLMNIRRCGHSENFFFIEVGRSAVTGPGEFWMQVDDSVVAQNMHETILEAMKAMSEEFRPRSKSQSSSNCSNPISVPLRRHHINNPPPSQVGLSRRSRTESVPATSPAGASKQSSFRVRASSDGEGTMSRPASVDGSPVSPSATRPHSHRHRGSSRLHPPLNHSRSIPMSSSRCSPSATSPVSLSSSSTSGHGSTSDCLFPRRSSASVSGSPSDGGFISSDEYGSSPCDFRNSFRSVTPDSLGHTPPAREEELNNYICMGKPNLVPNGHYKRSHQRYMPTRGEEADLEKSFRKRTHSAGTSPTISHQKTPSQSSTASLEEYTEMMPSYPCSRLPSYRHSAFVPTHSYPEECLDLHIEGNRANPRDDGYMPMSPGVAPIPNKNGDYVPMSPKSVSAPQQIINPRRHSQMDSNGYMMMSPSGSCSPDSTNYGKIWTNGANPKLSVDSNDGKLPCGDYINMSPVSGSTTSTPPDCCFNPVDEPPKPIYSYFSLPRSFKHMQRKNDETQLRISVSSGRLMYGEDSSSSTSSDSLGGQDSEHQTVNIRKVESCVQTKGRLIRPTRLTLDNAKASTLPRTREHPLPPEPKSPGEYVNIEFGDKAFLPSSVSFCSSAYTENNSTRQRENLSEYMNMDLGARAGKPSFVSKSSVDITSSASGCATSTCRTNRGQPSCDYVSMQLGATCPNFSESPVMIKYTEMATGVAKTSPRSTSPKHEIPSLNSISDAALPSLVGQSSGMSAFTRVNLSPNRNQGAKVIRADPQGRRRHSSETFSSTPSASGVALSYVDDVKRHSSASFENVWIKQADSTVSVKKEQLSDVSSLNSAAAFENGLNYIDLDLAKDFNNQERTTLQPKSQNQPCGSNSSDDLSAYASISFQKPEDLRINPAKREGDVKDSGLLSEMTVL
ncbi:insulin receptor substrate 1-B isoform X2 [Latimeria chalumnae]|uniref:insulin receptor substrate 1-B isoform X2 n=1 Tax=Latimeria chalumnae TaxID=7897 RepID=UPI0003C184F4|nr:PREDICTED: insulin receptor substrate 1 isoform X1 [Latimeria chalumnae]|eukprot:XP_005993098.1 PREDICTED: insulin receptor substrate 1 isoform X1 [Latimeria chalumnae]